MTAKILLGKFRIGNYDWPLISTKNHDLNNVVSKTFLDSSIETRVIYIYRKNSRTIYAVNYQVFKPYATKYI